MGVKTSGSWKVEKTIEERFWSKVDRDDPSGCWVWHGATRAGGYGQIRDTVEAGKRRISAHHLSLRFVGREPLPGQAAHHICENPPCVNPDHLVVVSRKGRAIDGGSHLTLHAKWNTEKLIEALHECSRLQSRFPMTTDFNVGLARYAGRDDLIALHKERGWPHYASFLYYFGTWRKALEAAGFPPPRKPGRPPKHPTSVF